GNSSELPKVSLVNANLKKLKFHLTQFDSIVKKKTTPNALEEGKEIVENVVHTPSATTIAPGMFKLDLEPLPPRLLQNREVHIDYLRNTQEQPNILREIVEQAKEKQPLDSELNLACKYATRIQELLVYVQDMCPNAIIPSAKKVTVKPMNDVKKVRSKPPGNKRNDRISQSPSMNKKNKVEAQPRKANKVNHVVKPVCDVNVKHSLSKANFEILCATCNKSMFDGVHDKYLLDLVQNGNKRSRDTNLYIISLDDMIKSSPICLLSKASKSKSWLWHRRLSHLNFGTLNKLAKDGLARGIPRLKFQKDHLCSACALGKSKKSSHQPKAEDTNQEKLYLLHMDLCGPMHVASINEKRYILVIVDDYSRFTWVRFLKTKDEAPAAIIKCIKNIQVRLKATVRNVQTDNGTGFVNQILREWYENVDIIHQTSVARTPQQNGVVERRNRTLVEAS
ncbi:retrovirus-related pol polyprotein from transposon TNT 1-94, partial [Tanacetum coccineum]